MRKVLEDLLEIVDDGVLVERRPRSAARFEPATVTGDPTPHDRLLQRRVDHHVDAVHRAGRQRAAMATGLLLARCPLGAAAVVLLTGWPSTTLPFAPGAVVRTRPARTRATPTAAAANGELRVEVVEGLRADPRHVAVAEGDQVAIDDPTVLLERRRRPAAGLVLDPALAELAEGTAVPRERAVGQLEFPGVRLALGLLLVLDVGSLRLVPVLAGERTTPEGDPQFPSTRRQLTHTRHGPTVWETEGCIGGFMGCASARWWRSPSGWPLSWDFVWHPQRDSNPCRHLERVVS